MTEIQIIFISFSIIFSLIAAYLSFRCMKSWKENEFETIKAKVFLDKSFLNNNFKFTLALVWIMIGFVGIHSIMEYIEYNGKIFDGFYFIYYGVMPLTMLSLMKVTYMWLKVLNRHQYKMS